MTKKRVFHFISHFDMGGAERVAASIAQSHNAETEYHVVEMMHGRGDFTHGFIGELEASGVRCHRAWMPDVRWHFLLERITALLAPLWLLPLWLRWRPDVVHTHTELPDLCTVAFFKAWPWLTRNCRVVRTVHNTQLWTGQKRLGRMAERFFQQRADVVAISLSTRDCYMREYGAVLPIIYNGVDACKEKRRYEYLKEGKVNVIFAGRFEAQKGISTLIKIVKAVGGDGRYHFHVFGDGSLRQLLVDELGKMDCVSLRPPLFNLPAYLGSFHYMLMPSEFEGLSIVALEAAMGGTPTIVNDCPGLGEIFPEGWPLKVKGNDLDAYVRIFRETIPHADRQALADEAHAFAMEHFSVEAMRRGYEGLYLTNASPCPSRC